MDVNNSGQDRKVNVRLKMEDGVVKKADIWITQQSSDDEPTAELRTGVTATAD